MNGIKGLLLGVIACVGLVAYSVSQATAETSYGCSGVAAAGCSGVQYGIPVQSRMQVFVYEEEAGCSGSQMVMEAPRRRLFSSGCAGSYSSGCSGSYAQSAGCSGGTERRFERRGLFRFRR